jgi:hypothetical protein
MITNAKAEGINSRIAIIEKESMDSGTKAI